MSVRYLQGIFVFILFSTLDLIFQLFRQGNFPKYHNHSTSTREQYILFSTLDKLSLRHLQDIFPSIRLRYTLLALMFQLISSRYCPVYHDNTIPKLP